MKLFLAQYESHFRFGPQLIFKQHWQPGNMASGEH
jgi:hypothetical protein